MLKRVWSGGARETNSNDPGARGKAELFIKKVRCQDFEPDLAPLPFDRWQVSHLPQPVQQVLPFEMRSLEKKQSISQSFEIGAFLS